MTKFTKYRGKVLKTAIITSPLIGIYSIVPVFFFMNSGSNSPSVEFTPTKTLTVISVISFTVFLMWMWNFFLEHNFNKIRKSVPAPYAKTVKYLLSYLIIFLVVIFRFVVAEEVRPQGMGWFEYYPFVGSFAANTFILVLVNLIITQTDKSELELQKANLEISQLTLEQEQLKQRIHPHFLFNTLSTLQILIEKDAEKAVGYTRRLAGFLRSSFTLTQNDVIPLATDLSFMVNYIDLQNTRFNDSIVLEVAVPDSVLKKGRLPVFALQTLAENAVKHNSFSAKNRLKISVCYNSDGRLTVSNLKSPRYSTAETTGTGLKNLRERYAHFTDKLPVTEEAETHFAVKLYVLGI